MRYFDSRDAELGVKHIMASGALPPAFPAVRIDGELYWDGGILSNTPTEAVFDDNPRKNSLIFAVPLWNLSGTEPTTMAQVLNRHKDVQYSSRIASHIARQQQAHRLRHVINQLVARLPEDDRRATRCGNRELWLSDADACGAAAGAASRPARTTPRTSISVRLASCSAGMPAIATPGPCSNASLGLVSSINSRELFSTRRWRYCRRLRSDTGTDPLSPVGAKRTCGAGLAMSTVG